MSKTTKVSIIIIVVLTVFLLVVFLLSTKDEVVFQSNNNEGYLIIGQNAIFSYHNKKYYNVPLNSQVMKELDWKKFKVYEDYKVKGNYLMHYDEKWYLFTEEKTAVNYEENIIAIKSNYNLNYKYENANKIVDYQYVNKVAQENGVLLNNLTVEEEVTMDIDNDGNNEVFYLISTALPIIPRDEKEYSIVFMVKDEKIYPIYNSLKYGYKKNSCQPKIEGFVNLNGNKNYEIILSCSTIGPKEQKVYLYEIVKENKDLYFELKASNT